MAHGLAARRGESMAHQRFGDLVVAIPGILGSRLVRKEGGRCVTVWDLSIRRLPALLKALVSGGVALEGNGVDPPDDGIEAVDLFSYQLLPGFFGVDDYASLIESLERSVSPRQVITFPYDWRLSNRHAARALERVASDALRLWRAESGHVQAKLWLICHSMGGLVARYFCEALGGAAETRAVITIGTPHRGSIRALEALVNGKRLGPIDVTRMVRSLPSAYELLPLFPAVRQGSEDALDRRPDDAFDQRPDDAFTMVRVAELFGLDPITGDDVPGWVDPVREGLSPPLPGLDRAMLKRALEFHAAIRGPAETRAGKGEPSPYRLEAFFNRRQPTALSARLEGQHLQVFNTHHERRAGRWVEEDARGDGTVPSFAAVPIEWDDTSRAVPLGERHAAMPAGAAVRDAIFNWLRPLDVRAKKGVGTDDDDVIALDIPSVLTEGDDLPVTLSARRPANGFVDVVDVDTGARASRPFRLAGLTTPWTSVFPRLTPGVHRVVVRPADQRQLVISDHVFVAER